MGITVVLVAAGMLCTISVITAPGTCCVPNGADPVT
jgi:hypothetical protein